MKKKIFVAGIYQESNSFSPLMSQQKDFTCLRGEQLIRKTPGAKELIDAGYDIIPGLCASACPGGILKLEEFRKMAEEILDSLPLDGSVNGIFFPSHGALEVEFIGSGDTLLISMLRERVGPRVPIALALDLHANNTYTLARLSNIIYGYRTAPHTDIAQTSIRTAKLLMKAIDGRQEPWTELIRIPFMMPGENMMTESGFGKEVIEMVTKLEQVPGIWCSSFFAGMPWVDCAQGGASIVISGVGDKLPGLLAAKKLAREIWSRRLEFRFQGISMPPLEALLTLDHCGHYPAFLSDSADNITAGAAGDNGYMLNLILKHKIEGVLAAPFIDAPAVKMCAGKHMGDVFDLGLGAALDVVGSTQVVLEQAQLVGVFYKDGKAEAAVVKNRWVTVLILAKRGPIVSEEALNSYGLSAFDYRIIVVKQGYLTPEFNKILRAYVMALTPGNCAQDLAGVAYRRIRVPMEPLAAVADEERVGETYEAGSCHIKSMADPA